MEGGADEGTSRSGEGAKILLDRVVLTFRRQHPPSVVEALGGISMAVPDHRFVALVGPSGCGKTTLLRIVNGLIAPDSGRVLIDGRPPRPGPEMGFVFQSFRLIPWTSVRNNIAFPLEVAGMGRAERRERADHYLDLVGLKRFADAYPAELSGGMKQRAALARALAAEPDILLMDEPFASIDAQTRELMQIELMRLWSLRKSVVLFVTHSVDEAVLLADSIVLMSPRPGRILEVIDVDLPRPRWEYEARTHPAFIELRTYLWNKIRALVIADEHSDFYGRDITDGPADAAKPADPARPA